MRLASLAVVAACAQPRTLVICHNANCVDGADPANDDTLPALRASLALAEPDGIDVDTVWDPERNTCMFGHELDGSRNAPAEELARELAGVRDGFVVKIGLKPHAGDAEAHADCALDVAASVSTSAELIFASEDPALLAALVARPRFPRGARISLDIGEARLADIPSALHPDFVQFYAPDLGDTELRAQRSLGAELALWMTAATPATLATIRTTDPAFVVTSEARLLRGWLSAR